MASPSWVPGLGEAGLFISIVLGLEEVTVRLFWGLSVAGIQKVMFLLGSCQYVSFWRAPKKSSGGVHSPFAWALAPPVSSSKEGRGNKWGRPFQFRLIGWAPSEKTTRACFNYSLLVGEPLVRVKLLKS